jgi:hypothetical protein
MNLKDCKWSGCCWKNRYEMLGIAFLVIATVLTIIAWDSFGIVAMFVVGLVLIGHKNFCYFGCRCHCHTEGEMCDMDKCAEGGECGKGDKEHNHKKKEEK